MNGLIRASLGNPYAVTVMSLTLIVLGVLSIQMIPIDILPVFRSPAVQTLTFYNGMSANGIANDITNRMERWTGQANGMARQESRSIIGASIVRNYFQGDVDPNGALTQVNSLALAAVPNLPPGTLPPVVLPFDPTSTTPVSIVALDSDDPANNESILYDVGRYEVRNMIMGQPGAVAPVVYGGKIRAVMAYLDRQKMQARGLSPLDVMKALDASNVFLPTGDAKFGDLDYAIDSNSMYEDVEDMGDIPLRMEPGNSTYLRDVATPKDANFIQTNVVRVDGKREVYIPVFRQLGASTLGVVENSPRLAQGYGREADAVGDQPQAGHGPVGVCPEIDRGPGPGGAARCGPLLAGHPDLPGRVADDRHRHHDAADLGPGGTRGLYLAGQTINTMTLAGLTLAIGPLIDTSIICLENTHRHLGMGVSPREAAFLGTSEVATPAAGLDSLHLSGALAAGLHAWTRSVPVQADGHGGGVRDDRGVHPCADSRPGLQRKLAQAARGPCPRRRTWRMMDRSSLPRMLRLEKESETFQINGNGDRRFPPEGQAQSGLRAMGADDRDGDRLLRQGPGLCPPAPDHGGTDRVLPPGGHRDRPLARAPARVLPGGRRRLVRDVCPCPQRPADRADRGADRGGGAVRPQDDRRGGPATHPLGDRRDLGLVGGLHAQCRPDGRGGQDPAHRPSGRSRPRSMSRSSDASSRKAPPSATWSSPSTPAAWSARR